MKIQIEIDGQSLEVEQGMMLIEAADAAEIRIPRFCYHKKLSVAANCRMCLVEVDKVGKPLPACATPVSSGMKVFTQSPKALEAQQSVMEFLLINHPLDCPICDQGGECELQDISMGYGKDVSRFNEGKRAVEDEDLGSLIATDMTRCIHCTRCVRFGQEIAGLPELGATGRGEHMRIGTYIKHSLTSEMSGNIIDLCPVGALTSKPFRFTARSWELRQTPSIAPHDGVGSNIYVHRLGQQVKRVVPRDNESINETWISDRDRFSYQALNSDDRLLQPMIKKAGQWQTVDWVTALQTAVNHLKTIQSDQWGAVLSPSSTLEEAYLLQKLGSSHVSHQLRQTNCINQTSLRLPIPIEEIEKQNTILLIGSHVRAEQPIIAHRIRKAVLAGAKVIIVNAVDFDLHFEVSEKMIVKPQDWLTALNALSLTPDNGNTLILLGELALNHPDATAIHARAEQIAVACGGRVGCLTAGANNVGISQMIEKSDLTVTEIFQKNLKGFLLLGVEPEFDCANPQQALRALHQANCVIAITGFKNPAMLEYAHVLLPQALFAETSGTYVNMAGTWQSFSGVVKPRGEARPAWKILRVLGNLLGLPDFNYESSEDVVRDMSVGASRCSPFDGRPMEGRAAARPYKMDELTRITYWPLYNTDATVRHAPSLQQSATHELPAIRLNTKTAQRLNWNGQITGKATQNENTTTLLPVVIDDRVADDCVVLVGGAAETAQLGDNFGPITIEFM